ncbi:alpha/beta hydrolase [Planococcus shenhongbingii]|uniref:Alpha/beta hydrolase n=1 Tax=Planococcus shenhongbingii TaxID=3058398 RepID=A0ABT8NDU6_9BACL|nr:MULTISPECIES: alpha/beta hydrolase [unclassified Planococcus (in: firmicutes)]MDN7246070.1 alpha/beta hydrolase [Planococcus sp. N017]WKA59801.1 alpha/beta hydrolase [Planococcus sp. N016]
MWKWEAKGQAKAVIVLVHSAYEHHIRYAWQIDQWRSENFHVITGDLPGHGKSAPANQPHQESFIAYEESVRASTLAALEEQLPVFIVAHGLGATIVMNFLSHNPYPIAGVVFSSPWLRLIKTPSKFSAALTGLHKLTSNMAIEHHIHIHDLTRNKEVIEQEKDDSLYNSTVTVGWYHELQTYLKQTAQNIGKFPDIPIFIQTGEVDAIADQAYTKLWLKQQELKEFSFKEWPRCYHDLFQEPEREDVFISSHLFIKNVLRSLGYVVT